MSKEDSMTKKDYDLLAGSIRAVSRNLRGHQPNGWVSDAAVFAIEAVARQLAMDLKDANPLFDETCFLRAANYDMEDEK